MDADSPEEVAGRYDERTRQRRQEREQRAMHHRTNPLTGRMHVPLADRLTDAYDELDAATVSLWKAEQKLYRHLRVSGRGGEDSLQSAPPAEEKAEEGDQPYAAHHLEDARAEARLEYDLGVNQVQRLEVLVRLYEAGGLAD